ncbi:MAG: hypothetical protein WBO88_16325, partial [Candidatus Dechloromonas phosphoritropha]
MRIDAPAGPVQKTPSKQLTGQRITDQAWKCFIRRHDCHGLGNANPADSLCASEQSVGAVGGSVVHGDSG